MVTVLEQAVAAQADISPIDQQPTGNAHGKRRLNLTLHQAYRAAP
jgi:hypothetical protein